MGESLCGVHPCDEARKNAVCILRIRSGDVGCITVDARTRIDQETVDLSRGLAVVVLVMEDASMFVECNDTGIR